MSRSNRTLIAIVLWLLAGFMAINNVIQGAALGDWLIPVILFVAGLILSLYPDSMGVVSDDHAHEPASVTPPAAKPALQQSTAQTEVESAPIIENEPVPEAVVEAPAAAAMMAEGAPPPDSGGEPDDLTKVEGIGPKMSAALIASGIDTFAKLAVSTEEELRDAIKSQGMRFAPSLVTWADQASFAAKGDWDGLSAMQDTLKAGRRG